MIEKNEAEGANKLSDSGVPAILEKGYFDQFITCAYS